MFAVAAVLLALVPVSASAQSSVSALWISAGPTTVTEGSALQYTLYADRAPASALRVRLWAYDTQPRGLFQGLGGRHVNGFTYYVTFPANQTSASFSLPTNNDSVDEASADAFIQLTGDSGYRRYRPPPTPSNPAPPASWTHRFEVLDNDGLAVSVTITDNVGDDLDGDGRVDAQDRANHYDRVAHEYRVHNERKKRLARLNVHWGRNLRDGERLEVPISFSGASNFSVYPELSIHEWDSSRGTLVVTGPRSNGSAGLIVEAYPDGPLGEADETLSMTVGTISHTGDVDTTPATGAGAVSGTITIKDNYLSSWPAGHLPHVSISGPSTVISGGTATFTLTANPPATRPMDVLLHVSDGPEQCHAGRPLYDIHRCSDWLKLTNEGFKTVRIPANTETVTYDVKVESYADWRLPAADITVSVRGNTQNTNNRSNYAYYPGSPRKATARVVPVLPATLSPEPQITITTTETSATEGAPASFTIHADPAPGGPMIVNLATDAIMGVGGSLQIRHLDKLQVLLQAGQTSRTWTHTVRDDSDHLGDGTLTASIAAGDHYDIGTPSSVTMPLIDDDAPVPESDDNGQPKSSTDDNSGTQPSTDGGGQQAAEAPLVKYAALVKSFYDRITANHQHGDGPSGGWNKRFLKAMGHPEYINYPQPAVTAARAQRWYDHGGPGANTAWAGTVEAIEYANNYTP